MAERFILGISTSALAEVALVSDTRSSVAAASQHGQALSSLVPLLQRALDDAPATLRDVALVTVCTGPGSFTGLRIGVAFAKSLAQARGIPIVGVSAYDVAEFHIQEFPVVAIAKGKTDYYYARIKTAVDQAAEYTQGDRAAIMEAARRVSSTIGKEPKLVGTDFSAFKTGTRAESVALLGRRAFDRHPGAWCDVVIDYGQRPNAVLNWEQRQPREEGRSFQRREVRGGEGPSSHS